MGTKRPNEDVHPSRRHQVEQPAQPPRKRRRPDYKKPPPKKHPVNDLKSRARSISRLLARENVELDAHIRIAKKRELQSIQYDLEVAKKAEKKKRLITRYHHVRFFERQKATRAHKKAKKELQALAESASADERRRRQDEVEETETDINYTIYYPLDKKYVSMYVKEDQEDSAASRIATRGDPEMRKLVKECMRNGTLDALREGKLTGREEEAQDADEAPKLKPMKKTKKLTNDTEKKDEGSRVEDDDDDDSDGGFFE